MKKKSTLKALGSSLSG